VRERVPVEAWERLADDGRNNGPQYSPRRPPADELGLGLTSFTIVAALARLDGLFRQWVTYFESLGNRIDIILFFVAIDFLFMFDRLFYLKYLFKYIIL
jgi:hypothetical protein